MNDTSATLAPDERPTPFVSVTLQQLTFVLAIGLIVGALVWGLTQLFDAYVAVPLLCGGEGCAVASRYSEIGAVVLASGLGLFGLVKLRVYRPLLIALASAVTLWGIVGYASPLFPWYGVLIATALLYMLGYVAYAWLSRIRLFWLAALIFLLVIVATRLILS